MNTYNRHTVSSYVTNAAEAEPKNQCINFVQRRFPDRVLATRLFVRLFSRRNMREQYYCALNMPHNCVLIIIKRSV
jgi:hypothetical protein